MQIIKRLTFHIEEVQIKENVKITLIKIINHNKVSKLITKCSKQFKIKIILICPIKIKAKYFKKIKIKDLKIK